MLYSEPSSEIVYGVFLKHFIYIAVLRWFDFYVVND